MKACQQPTPKCVKCVDDVCCATWYYAVLYSTLLYSTPLRSALLYSTVLDSATLGFTSTRLRLVLLGGSYSQGASPRFPFFTAPGARIGNEHITTHQQHSKAKTAAYDTNM